MNSLHWNSNVERVVVVMIVVAVVTVYMFFLNCLKEHKAFKVCDRERRD